MATVRTLAQIGTQSWAGLSKPVSECLDCQAQLKWSLDDELGRMSLEEKDGEPMVIQCSAFSGAAQQGIGCQQVGLAVVGGAKSADSGDSVGEILLGQFG